MYRQFNIQQFYILPTQCVYLFCVDLRTNSDYFTVQHWLVGFYNRYVVCLLRGTFYILRSANTVYRGADKFLARQGRKQATATEAFDVHICYL